MTFLKASLETLLRSLSLLAKYLNAYSRLSTFIKYPIYLFQKDVGESSFSFFFCKFGKFGSDLVLNSCLRVFYTVHASVYALCLFLREEVFGPVAPLLRFQTEEEAIHMANDTNAGLSLTCSNIYDLTLYSEET